MKKREIEKLIKMEINNATPHRAKEICGEKRVNRFFSFKRLGLIGSFAVMLCMCIILPLAINNNKQRMQHSWSHLLNEFQQYHTYLLSHLA